MGSACGKSKGTTGVSPSSDGNKNSDAKPGEAKKESPASGAKPEPEDPKITKLVEELAKAVEAAPLNAMTYKQVENMNDMEKGHSDKTQELKAKIASAKADGLGETHKQYITAQDRLKALQLEMITKCTIDDVFPCDEQLDADVGRGVRSQASLTYKSFVEKDSAFDEEKDEWHDFMQGVINLLTDPPHFAEQSGYVLGAKLAKLPEGDRATYLKDLGLESFDTENISKNLMTLNTAQISELHAKLENAYKWTAPTEGNSSNWTYTAKE